MASEQELNELKKSLVTPEEEVPEVPQEEKKLPLTVNAFGKGAAQVSGPFARTRVNARSVAAKKKDDVSTRRGEYRIWDNKPVKHVGEGTNTYDTKQKD